MANKEEAFYENLFYTYLEEFKFLFFPDKWGSISFDFSKNELLAIIFIYKHKRVNTSEIAEYINAPLNTVTGVINRLEKKKIVQRTRDVKDKRVVNISLTDYGEEIFNKEKEEIFYYLKKIYSSLTNEEKTALISIVAKIIPILKEGKDSKDNKNKEKKIRKILIE